MEILLVCVILYILVGFFVADHTTPEGGSGYLYVVLLWGIFVPVALVKSFRGTDDDEEDLD